MVSEGEAAAEIVQAATDAKSDLIVLGTHGRTGLQHLAMGSVTEKVLRQASVPGHDRAAAHARRRAGSIGTLPPGAVRDRLFRVVDAGAPTTPARSHRKRVGGSPCFMPSSSCRRSGARRVMGDADGGGLLRRPGASTARRSWPSAVPSDVREYCEVETLMVVGHTVPGDPEGGGERERAISSSSGCTGAIRSM